MYNYTVKLNFLTDAYISYIRIELVMAW